MTTLPTKLDPSPVAERILKIVPIVGISFRPKEVKKAMSAFNINTPIYFVQEKDNKFDSFAIKVMSHNADGERIFCGYVPAAYSQVFSTLLDHDIHLYPYIVSVNPNGEKGLEIFMAVQLA